MKAHIKLLSGLSKDQIDQAYEIMGYNEPTDYSKEHVVNQDIAIKLIDNKLADSCYSVALY